MASPLEGAIAKKIGAAFANIFYACTVTRETPGVGGTAQDPADPVQTHYTCKGIVEDWRADQIDGTLIQVGDRKVIILATSLAIVPKPGDKVTIRAETFSVMPPVRQDPAGATFELIARKS